MGRTAEHQTRDTQWPIGAHLVTPRRGYTHHGIYAGDGMVVHYAGFSRALRRGPVQQVPLSTFAAGRVIWVEPVTRPGYSGDEAVRRACSRLGEDGYRLLTNNCEHFCGWCLYGEARSAQVDRLLAAPRAAARTFKRLLARAASRAVTARPCAA